MSGRYALADPRALAPFELVSVAAAVDRTTGAVAVSDRGVPVAIGGAIVGGSDRGGGQAKPEAGGKTDAGIAAPVAGPAVVAAVSVARGAEAAAISAEMPMMVPDADPTVAVPAPEAMETAMVAVEAMPPAIGTRLARRREQDEG